MIDPGRRSPARLLLAWLAGALLLVGLPGQAASVGASGGALGAASAGPRPTAAAPAAIRPAGLAEARGRSAAVRVPGGAERVAHRGTRADLLRSAGPRYSLAGQHGAGQAGPLAIAGAGLDASPPAGGAIVRAAHARVLGTPAPAGSRGRAPPAAGSSRIAGVHSA